MLYFSQTKFLLLSVFNLRLPVFIYLIILSLFLCTLLFLSIFSLVSFIFKTESHARKNFLIPPVRRDAFLFWTPRVLQINFFYQYYHLLPYITVTCLQIFSTSRLSYLSLHPFIQKYLWEVYYLPHNLQGTGQRTTNKGRRDPVLIDLPV